MENHQIRYVHFAPPCGTATRAREIRRAHGPDPKPLRSVDHPNGLPNLSGDAKAKVDSANLLYEFVALAMVRLTIMKVA
eukprot:892588-Karenia_brevis.AAC.1